MDDIEKKKSLLNREYIEFLIKEYLSFENQFKAPIIAQRIITEYEVEVFSRIRELCHKEN